MKRNLAEGGGHARSETFNLHRSHNHGDGRALYE
jgi:hypothetical protein